MRDGDIRDWASPHRQSRQTPPAIAPVLPRRRRIIESDDDDEEQPVGLQPQNANAIDQPMPQLDPPLPRPALPPPDVVLLDTSESDDMYVYNAAMLPPLEQAPQVRSVRETSTETTPARARRVPDRSNTGRRAASRCRFEEEAEESTDVSDDNSRDCIESDTSARRLYHDAMLGVRNARNARAQMRRITTSCPVCAIFAEYLAHFV